MGLIFRVRWFLWGRRRVRLLYEKSVAADKEIRELATFLKVDRRNVFKELEKLVKQHADLKKRLAEYEAWEAKQKEKKDI